jgi:hypothetical protein
MHSVLWASILASAGVAVVTTLLIEYLAKPWLEARKERILDKGRQRRSAFNNFRRAVNLANRLRVYKGRPSQFVSLMDEQIKRSATGLQEYTLSAFEFVDVPKSVSREWEYTLSSMNAYGTVFSAGSQYLTDDIWEQWEAALNQ